MDLFQIPASGQPRGKVSSCLYINGGDHSDGFFLADSGNVMDENERKEFNIDTIDGRVPCCLDYANYCDWTSIVNMCGCLTIQ